MQRVWLKYIVGSKVIAIGFTQADPSILLSNRINGLTSVILGLFLSLVLWNSIVVNLQLKERIMLQQKELENKNEKLQYLATHDSLTGLVNRRYFEEQIISEILSDRRNDEKSCLVLLDVDDFKVINDKYGHIAGDKILQNIASILRANLRETDVVSRIGGDEFIIILKNSDLDSGKAVAEKLRNYIEKESFIIDGMEINVTVSVGVSLIDNRTESYEEVYGYADNALYFAKSKGKNYVVLELKP